MINKAKKTIKNTQRKIKPTFEEFLQNIYFMTYGEYLLLNDHQQKAVDIDYKDMYR